MVPQKYEYISRRPILAIVILMAGASTYGVLCQPAIWTRGYPRLNPFWDFIPWLWFGPVIISGIFDNRLKRRFWTLMAYAILTGVVAGATVTNLVPKRVTWHFVLTNSFLFAVPVHLFVTWLAERYGQRWLSRFRRFSDEETCVECGYKLCFLSVPRCPECGTPFDEERLTVESLSVVPTNRPWRVWSTLVVSILILIASPFVYGSVMLSLAERRGRAEALRDWEIGVAEMRVDVALNPWFYHRMGATDPLSGLKIRIYWKANNPKAGLCEWLRHRAYAAIVEQKLLAVGKDCLTTHLYSFDELASLMAEAEWKPIQKLPFTTPEGLQFVVDREELIVMGKSTSITVADQGIQYAVMEGYRFVLIVAGDQLLTVHRDGVLLQNVGVLRTTNGWSVIQ